MKSFYLFMLALFTVSQKEQLQIKCVICALLNLRGYTDSEVTTSWIVGVTCQSLNISMMWPVKNNQHLEPYFKRNYV